MRNLLLPSQAAEILAISTKQLHALTAAGEIAFVNVGVATRPTRRYRPEDIEEFIAQRRTITRPFSLSRPSPPRYLSKITSLDEALADLARRRAAKKAKTPDGR